jgi:tetratricopeptide (TPR) repeat protein
MSETEASHCGDERIVQILEIASADTPAGIAEIDAALETFPDDARLHFLKGSLLIGEKRFIAAHTAMTKAVTLAPDFHLARFQLGFFELTSGEADTARQTWVPLLALPDDHFLRHFVSGLDHLVADRFDACIEALQEGIALNAENAPLNNDMQLIIERCRELGAGNLATCDEQAVSATSLLLGATRRPN